MDSPTNLLQFVVWDRLPFALAVVVIAFIGGRIAARCSMPSASASTRDACSSSK